MRVSLAPGAWVDGNGGRRREIGGCEDRMTSAASSPIFDEPAAAGGWRWPELEEDVVPVILVPGLSTVVAGGRSCEVKKETA
ncbi:hypothetical protein L3X38_010259 [Prunus dulcis]|uniref:Uncharacterized protein n=1 Tax=Prunus dulcis TaxID=3755 RepID=A0AAD4ZE15_PRUDU|nr:hypothetical protein L3X38_010259 [Prunus dulcis]